jgi:hypothetical protein
MKRYIVIGALMSLSFTVEAGCDMCSLYLGVHPNQVKRGITMRYRYSQFQTNHLHNHDSEHQHSTSNNETYIREYQSLEVWTQWMPFKKLQVLAMIPYSMNAMYSGNSVIDAYNNIGDAQVLGRYQLYRSEFDSTDWQHRIVGGLGLKLPTGSYEDSSQMEYLDQHLQNGTGSWDLIFNLGYLIKYRNWGYNQEIIYKYNNANKNNFRFASQVNLNGNLFYQYTQSDWSFIPSVGYLIEHAGLDQYNGATIETSNGTTMYALINLDLYWRRIGLQGSYQGMVIEDFNDPSMHNQNKWVFGISYNF